MKDLTQGSVTKHLLHMSAFMAVSMIVSTLYLLLDMYWVGHLGKEAIAAVGLAGNLNMIVIALTQMLGVGTTALISQAAGRKDQPRAEHVFNQSVMMSILVGLLVGMVVFLMMGWYTNSLAADATTASLARSYLMWFIPALMLQFPFISLGSALRSTGIVKPTVVLQILSVFINGLLAPFLILGWLGFPKLGVAGAALATFIAILISGALLIIYFEKKFHYLRFRAAQLRPQMKTWWAMLKIGLPAGAEFVLLFVYITLVFSIIDRFGSAAQAGFSIGVRVMQSLFLPMVALSLAVSPVVGQNFGGRQAQRVRHSVYAGLAFATALMLVLAAITWAAPGAMVRLFNQDKDVVAFGRDYLNIIAFNFIAAGIVFTSSSVFQGLGNTIPPLLSSASRLILFALPALIISHRGTFDIKIIWYLSVVSQILQACFNLLLLRNELHKKLKFDNRGDFVPASATAS
jgi:putative MATE family efflux protein